MSVVIQDIHEATVYFEAHRRHRMNPLPGSDAKLAVLSHRAMEGQELFCKDDGPGV